MSRVKYAPGETPLLNKHAGYTFQPNHYGQSMFPGAKNNRRRTPSQSQAQQNLMRCVRYWRTMSAGTQTNWETFAATYPQASRRNPALFLTGYQLFLKRNHYKFLNEGITANFMENPKIEELPEPSITFTIQQDDNCIDATENYIARFGIIPATGQFVILKAFPMARDSGQFFTPIVQTLEILESYIDGLFVSITFAAGTPAVDLSVYLSKPFYQSVKYAGTKVKYMSCFSGKSFLSLTDTPDNYAGQAEKQVAVKADETGLEFIAGGGGGLTCETMVLCPAWIALQLQVNTLAALVAYLHNLSLPPVNWGCLYNYFVFSDLRGFAPVGWSLPSAVVWDAMITSLGGTALAGDEVKDTDVTWWQAVVGATNSVFFNARPGGYRHYYHGTYSYVKQTCYYWSSTVYTATRKYGYIIAQSTSPLSRSNSFFNTQGASVRLVKDATTLSDGETGSMVGNDGQIYRTICINGVEWMADNSREAKYTNGDLIPDDILNANWRFLVTGAMAYPSGDPAYS